LAFAALFTTFLAGAGFLALFAAGFLGLFLAIYFDSFLQ
jgi:hypothetical protein